MRVIWVRLTEVGSPLSQVDSFYGLWLPKEWTEEIPPSFCFLTADAQWQPCQACDLALPALGDFTFELEAEMYPFFLKLPLPGVLSQPQDRWAPVLKDCCWLSSTDPEAFLLQPRPTHNPKTRQRLFHLDNHKDWANILNFCSNGLTEVTLHLFFPSENLGKRWLEESALGQWDGPAGENFLPSQQTWVWCPGSKRWTGRTTP